MSESTGRKGVCLLAWCGVLVVPAVLLLAIGWPWWGQVKALGREIESLDERIIRHHGVLRTLPWLQAELERVSSSRDRENFYFDAKTPAVAGAELQREVREMVDSAGGRVISTELLPSPQDAQPATVRVRTQMQGATDALLEVLYRIEQARPFLFVEQLSVRAARGQQRSERRGTWQASVLSVRLDVFGYALGETP